MNWETVQRSVLAGVLLALLPVPTLSAQSAFSAEEAAAAVRPAFAYVSGKLAPGAAKAEAPVEIAVDLALLGEDPAQLSVELPDGRRFLAVRQASWTEEGDRRYWSGGLHPDGAIGEEPVGRLSLSAEGAILAGSLSVAGASFEILPLAEGRQQLAASAARAAAGESLGEGATCTTVPSADSLSGEIEEEPDPNGKYPPSVVDVLVIFPRSLATSPTQTMQTKARIASWFGDANLALANSNVAHRYRAVYSGALTGEDQPPVAASPDELSTSLALGWLQSGPSEVTTLRNGNGADLVALFVPPDRNINCGHAELGSPSTDQYAVIDIGCASGEYLVAHELGHTLGMRHAPDEFPGTSPYAFAYGFDDNNALVIGGQRAATIMACNGNNNGNPNQTLTGIQCNRIPYFSSSSEKVDSTYIGNENADNAEVAHRQMYLTSLRRAAPVNNQTPRIDILRPHGSIAQSQQSLTFSASAWDREDGNIESSVRWVSNLRGYLGTGAVLSVYTSGTGAETFTATITDSGGLTASKSITLNFQPMVVTTGAIWHDPQFPGRFLSFNKTSNGSWVATWMAYEGSSPVWYLSPAVPVSGTNGAFDSELYRITFNPANGSQTPTLFADILISVETDQQIRLLIDPLSGPTLEQWLEPYTLASGPGGYWALNSSGQLDGGWTIWSGPTAFGGGGKEAQFIITFDGSQPVWVFGLGTRPVFQNFQMQMYRPTPATFTPNHMNPDGNPVGTLTTNYNINQGHVTLNFPSGNTWIKPSQILTPAAVR